VKRKLTEGCKRYFMEAKKAGHLKFREGVKTENSVAALNLFPRPPPLMPLVPGFSVNYAFWMRNNFSDRQ
jgi:hypothetical protein